MIRDLTEREGENLSFLNNYTPQTSVIILTQTGLNKSIMDATFEVRFFLNEANLHDYSLQERGQVYKKIIDTQYYHDKNFIDLKTSLYRPLTKDGDPRLWFLGIKKYISKGCAFALIAQHRKIYLFNLSNERLSNDLRENSAIKIFLEGLRKKEDEVANELLNKIINIYKSGWVKTIGKGGDKAVGHTLEQLLGIKTNNSKSPDYKGVEIKAFRKGKKGRVKTRGTLFGQVADWSISEIKSSNEMLKKFGYFRNGKERLNCTLSTITVNSQGLKLIVHDKLEQLHEVHDQSKRKCLVWPYPLLINRLKEKHAETFWVEAESRFDENGVEEFLYKKIIHTKKPNLSVLIPLIAEGKITMDHLISNSPKDGVKEKGPLFKIKKDQLGLLFPEPNEIDLSMHRLDF